jgi:hypothetical protein
MIGRCYFVNDNDINNTLEAHTLGVLSPVKSSPKWVEPCTPLPLKQRCMVSARTPRQCQSGPLPEPQSEMMH